MKLSSGFAAITFIAGLLVGLPLSVTANENSYENLTFCSNKKTGVLRYTDGTKCKKKELKILVGMQGPQGPIGPEGPKGDPGPAGPEGSTPVKLVQANGNSLPWELLQIAGDSFYVSQFAFSITPEGRIKRIMLAPVIKGYVTTDGVYYSDATCRTPAYYYYEESDVISEIEFVLRNNWVDVVRTNDGFAYIDKLANNAVAISGSFYRLIAPINNIIRGRGSNELQCVPLGWSPDRGIPITSLKPLPTLSFPLKWVAND